MTGFKLTAVDTPSRQSTLAAPDSRGGDGRVAGDPGTSRRQQEARTPRPTSTAHNLSELGSRFKTEGEGDAPESRLS